MTRVDSSGAAVSIQPFLRKAVYIAVEHNAGKKVKVIHLDYCDFNIRYRVPTFPIQLPLQSICKEFNLFDLIRRPQRK